MSISVQHVSKRFGKHNALDDVCIEARDGKLMALLGPSGSGKTTLLRIIAGLEIPDRGQILFRNADVTARSARDRNIGFVFQHYALFRHMTVFENVAFGLRVRHRPEPEIRERVAELLRLIRLEEMAQRYPNQLSGGQRQRVALARALAPAPQILLLDEPFGALDAKVRQELRVALRQLHDELHVTSIFVTHDQEEAFEVADEVVVMNEGKVIQVGTPQEVFERPANSFVMDFLGNVNVIPVIFDQTSSPAQLYVRSHELDISRISTGLTSLAARVVHINPAGPVVKVRLLNEQFGLAINVALTKDRHAELGLSINESVFVYPRTQPTSLADFSI